MKAIAFHVEKGGTGKTTMAGTVSFELARHAKTLMIDGDPQGNLTGWYVSEPIVHDLSDVLKDKAQIEDAILQVRENLYLFPTIAIDGELKGWSESQLPGKPFAIHDLSDRIDGFSYVVWDLGPGISILEKSILATVDEVIAVMTPETFSFDGLEIFERELEKLKKDRRAAFRVNKLVINRFNRSYTLHKAYLEQFDKLQYQVFEIGQSTGISDCVPSHQTVFEFDPRNRNLSVFEKLSKEVRNGST